MKQNKTTRNINHPQKQPADAEIENARKIALLIMKRNNPDWWNSRKLSFFYEERQNRARC